MATTTYEEEKKRVERPADLVMPTYAPPTNTATQQAQAEADAFYNELRQRYAQAADPAVQAAQDARIQRGRQFWTGANLFANVIANAINANGTAKGAPNMTWNDASTQKMYETWKDADARLRADRKEAQQRYDAMGLQQQQMRLAAAQAQDRAGLDAYKTNYAAQQEAAKFNLGNQWQDYRTQQTQDYQDKVRQQTQDYQSREAQKSRNFTASENEKSRTHSETMAEKKAQQAKGYNKGNKTIRIGNTDFKAETEAEADANIAQVYGMVLDAYNRQEGINVTNRQAFDGKPETEYSFINAHINQLYASDPAFKAQYDAWANEHRRSVNTNNQSSGSWLGGNNQGSWLQ